MLKRLIPHICIILSLMMLTFFVVDIFNPGMDFVGNEIFNILLVIFSVASITASGFLIRYNRKS
jgi:hypothetical protein